MSKASLKKELDLMDRQQLVDIILDIYTARSEAKEYFEFFINPDIDKLTDRVIDKAKKEIARVKRGSYSRLRISKIKVLDKYFASFNPGPDRILDMKFRLFNLCVLQSFHSYYPPALLKSVSNMLPDLIKYADTSGQFTILLNRLQRYLSNPFQADRQLKKMIAYQLNELGIDIKVNDRTDF
ncbi:MAG: hypothetical protein K2I94_03825 [Muribaculaceae bacterium]|nr:hypothetical protein [Muribaculaceae bacterium]